MQPAVARTRSARCHLLAALLAAVVLAAVAASSPAHAIPIEDGVPISADEFDGAALDSEFWATDEGSRWCAPNTSWRLIATEPCREQVQSPPYGAVSVAGGEAHFSSDGATRAFPYVWTNDGVFDTGGDFVLDIRMRYDSLLNHGNGMYAKTWPDATPAELNSPYAAGAERCGTLGIWGDSGLGRPAVYLLEIEARIPGAATAYHDYRFQYVGGKYFVFVDGQLLVGPVESPVRPDRLWLGNPLFTDFGVADWSDFTLDYVRVGNPGFVDSDGNGVHDGVQAWTPVNVPLAALQDADGDELPDQCDPNLSFDDFELHDAPPTRLRPLVLIPGISGSSLRNHDGELWPRPRTMFDSGSDNFLDPLRLAADGQSPLFPGNPDYSTVVVNTLKGYDGVIDDAQACFVWNAVCRGPGIYKPTVEYLQGRGYVLEKTLFPFAFDWRKSVVVNAERLKARIGQILTDPDVSRFGWRKVDLLAHSQGGLVANAMLSNSQPESDASQRVSRVVTLGTPYLGAVKAFSQLEYRQPCQIPRGSSCLLNPAKLQELVTNFPGFLELLPTDAYALMVTHPLIVGNKRLLWGEVVDHHLGDRNRPLIRAATALHRDLDQWSPRGGVPLLRMVGTGRATIRQVRTYRARSPFCSRPFVRPCPVVDFLDLREGSGDGTVSANSADLCNDAAAFDLRGGAPNYYAPGVSHGDLATKPRPLAAAVAFFNGTFRPTARACGSVATVASATATAAPAAFEASEAQAASLPVCADPLPDLSPEETLLNGTSIRTRGPLTGVIREAGGTELGVDATGEWIADVPWSDVVSWSDASSYFVGCGGDFQAQWTAESAAEVDLLFRTYANDEVVETASSPPIQVAAGARVSLVFSTPLELGAPVAVAIDDNGDGQDDRTVGLNEPVVGAAVDDDTPPVSTLGVTRLWGGRAKVTIAATDEDGGSGVASVDWEAPALGLSGVYSQPLVLRACGEIYARAVDRNGNLEADVKVATLDDRPGQPELVPTYRSPPFEREGSLDCDGDVDWWGVEVKQAGSYSLELDGRHGLELALFDASNNLVAADPEEIEVSLAPARYLVRVSGDVADDDDDDDDREYELEVEREDGDDDDDWVD